MRLASCWHLVISLRLRLMPMLLLCLKYNNNSSNRRTYLIHPIFFSLAQGTTGSPYSGLGPIDLQGLNLDEVRFLPNFNFNFGFEGKGRSRFSWNSEAINFIAFG